METDYLYWDAIKLNLMSLIPKSGNPIVDNFITTFLVLLSSWLTFKLPEVLKRFTELSSIGNNLLEFFGYTKNTLIFDGRVTRTAHKTTLKFSTKFKAILEHVSKLPYFENKIRCLTEIEMEDDKRDYFVSQGSFRPFKIEEGVWSKFSRGERDAKGSREEGSYIEERWQIEISSRTKSLKELKELVDQWESNYNKRFNHQEIQMTGKVMKSKDGWCNQFEFSDRFFAVLHKITTLSIENAPKHLFELHLKEPGKAFVWQQDDKSIKEKKREISRIVPSKFKFNEEVDGSIEIMEQLERGSEMISTKYTITISSVTKTSAELVKLIEQYQREYEEFKFSENGLKYYTYAGPPEKKQNCGNEPEVPFTERFTEFNYKSTKSFDKLFNQEKDEVMTRVKFFTENEDFYEERGIPHTLGFLFHGAPGCGKTSTIQAIANMTQRNIVNIPLKDIKDIHELRAIFYGGTINKKPIPMHKRLFVIEDIDCNALKKTVGKRTTENQDEESESEPELPEEEMSEQEKKMAEKKRQKKKKEKESKSKLTLGDLLEVFDGVLEMKGRMMVVTSNHPGKLDDALTRPGRLDVKIEFKKCRAQDIAAIVSNIFRDSAPDLSVADLPNCRWTPAEVTQILLGNMATPQKAIDILCSPIEIDDTASVSSGYSTHAHSILPEGKISLDRNFSKLDISQLG